ncbi:hypothetical protein EG329_004122 [Mollisiaceae sp. DMI_Dod_QoI]|nr:hypothetical protein EG329_004122 [Helotiales sp. DMI_Dod_QoI]
MAYSHRTSWATISETSDYREDLTDEIDSKSSLELFDMASTKCIVCNMGEKPGSNVIKCDYCRHGTYCSSPCQEQDWVVHKLVCPHYVALFEASPHPPPSHKVVIILPESDAKPQFMWMPFKAGTGDQAGRLVPDLRVLGREYSQGKQYAVSEILQIVNGSNPRFTTDHDVVMIGCELAAVPGRHNTCINGVMNKRAPAYWKGPHIILAQSKCWEGIFRNTTLHDLRITVDFLKTHDCRGRNEPFDDDFIKRGMYEKASFGEVMSKGTSKEMVKGVVISCLGDRNFLGRDHYTAVEVKKDHPAFSVNCTKISGAMDLLLVTFMVPADPLWRDQTTATLGYNPWENIEVTFMHLDVSAVDKLWGWANRREWDIRIGSVLVVRKDRKDITVHQVEALSRYCVNVIRPAMEAEIKLEDEREAKGQEMSAYEKRSARRMIIQKIMCQPAFDGYFVSMKKKKLEQDCALSIATQMAPSYCAACNKASPLIGTTYKECRTCKSATYLQAFTDSTPRPSTAHKLGILFPSGKTKPNFVWVECRSKDGWEDPDCGLFLECENDMIIPLYVSAHLKKTNPNSQRFALQHTIIMYAATAGEVREEDKSPENLCVTTLMNSKNKHTWKGPLLALSQPGTKTDPLFYQDVTCADLRILASFFRSYGAGRDAASRLTMISEVDALNAWFLNIRLRNPDMVNAVEISSDGERHYNDKVEFGRVEILKSHPIFEATQPTSISTYIGLPILVRKHGNIYLSSKYSNLNENSNAVLLNIDAKPESDKWDYTNLRQCDTDVGSVLVARQDKKDITPEQVEALVNFCRFDICPKMAVEEEFLHSWHTGPTYAITQQARTKFVKAHLTRAKFEDFFEKFRDEKLAAGNGAWEHTVSPYET